MSLLERVIRVAKLSNADIEQLAREMGRRGYVHPMLCVNCARPAEGKHGTHRDGFGDGPDVPLCDWCGSRWGMTLDEMWEHWAKAAKGTIKITVRGDANLNNWGAP